MKGKKNRVLTMFLLLAFILLSCGKTENKGTEEQSGRGNAETEKSGEETGEEKKAENAELPGLPHLLIEKNGETHRDADYHYFYRGGYSKLILKEEDSAFTALRNALSEYNKEVEEAYQKDFAELVNVSSSSEEAKRNIANFTGNTPEVDSNSFIIRSDKSIVSVLQTKSVNYTGNETSYVHSAVNFDSESGKRLAFSDVVLDSETFFTLAENKARESADMDTSFPVDFLAKVKEQGENLCWTVNAEGVSVYYDLNSSGQSLKDPMVLTVYFNEAEDLFNEKYTKTEEDYVLPLLQRQHLDIDLDGDGKREPVYLKRQALDGNFYMNMSVVANGKESGIVEGLDGWTYILKKSGKYYLYLFKDEDDGVTFLYRIDLSTVELNPDEHWFVDLSNKEYYWKTVDNVDKEHYIQESFTDAAGFCGGEGNEILSTNTVEIDWLIDENAYPKPAGNRYRVTSNRVLRALQDISAQEVDQNGKVLQDGTIPAGSYLLLMYSDNEATMEMRIIDEKYVDKVGGGEYGSSYYLNDFSQFQYDGNCYRIQIERDRESWTTKVNGIDAEELFEGMIYVG